MVVKRKKLVITVVYIVVGIIIGIAISSTFNLHNSLQAEDVKISQEAIDILSKTNKAITEVAATVKPSVVNISSSKTIKAQRRISPFFNDPFFKRFFGDEYGFFERPREFKQAALGSGVIVDKDGYILTNNHVISGADEIKIKLSDNREFVGKVIGTDQKTDLAVIKINAHNLPAIRFGDSDKIQVGETVLAIGNPFGLSHTVTSGIVSATGRANVGIADYEDFIQTDAAINPGNSGGGLVNVRGELVGINTAIFSTTGGYQGIGFTIPSNMAKTVMQSLIQTGKVVRGWLGVTIQALTPDLAKEFNIKDIKGVLVGDVVEDSPADKAGVKRGDVIFEYDGKAVNDPVDLRNKVASTKPNSEVSIKVLRNGEGVSLKVTISEMPGETQTMAKELTDQFRGVSVQKLTPALKKNLGIPDRIEGVVIADIEQDSPAESVFMKGDVIMEINRRTVRDMKDYEEIVSGIRKDEDILVLIYRKGSIFFVPLSGE